MHSRSKMLAVGPPLGSSWRSSLLAVCLVAALTARGDEKPDRFLNPIGWRLTFTQSFSWSGHRPLDPIFPGNCKVDWSYADTATITATLWNKQATEGGCVQWTGDLAELTKSLLFHERQVETCDSGVFIESTGDATGISEPPSLEICLGAIPAYVLKGGALSSEITIIIAGFKQVIAGAGPSLAVLNKTNFPPTGLIIEGSVALDHGVGLAVSPPIDPAMGESPPADITWRLEPILEDIEVIIEPQSYADWVPRGNLGLPTHRGNFIAVTARLQKRGGGPTTVRADSFQFELINVSKEPGVCMNFPVNNASDDPDLKFEAGLNPPKPGTGNSVTDDQVQIFTQQDGLPSAQVKASSFDFGAYGEIKVTANVPGYPPLFGHLKGTEIKEVPLPQTHPNSHIAQAWLRNNGGALGNLPDEIDLDPFPEGDGHKGDGLSLYQEYRGFSIRRQLVRTRGDRKDLFVRSDIRSEGAQAGIEQFKQASHLRVHEVDKDEIDPQAVINLNHGWAHQGFDQHGLIIAGRQSKTGVSQAENRTGFTGNSTPGSKARVALEPFGAGWGIDASQGGPGDALIFSEFFDESLAHELGHCCSVWHHGECDVSGKKAGLLWVDADEAGYLELRKVGGAISQTPINILNPAGGVPEILIFHINPATGIAFQSRYWMAVPHGPHSGDVSCIMCYDVADCFRRDLGANRYLNSRWPVLGQDHLCTSPTGTGVNASGTPGGPWLGDAYTGDAKAKRGNCAEQICVNDLYATDSKHDRDYQICPAW